METLTDKTAITTYPIHKLIAKRWSPRAFEQKAVAHEDLHSLFEAARWAPSAMNEQPWRFVYARKGEEAFEAIFDSLNDGNKTWVINAPVLIATFIKNTYTRNGAQNGSALHDLGLAVGNLSAQATDLGIGLHQMGGFNKEVLRNNLGVSADFSPVTVIAAGYYGEADQLSGALRERELAERTRLPLEEIVSHGVFNF